MKVVFLIFALLFGTVAFAEEFEDFPEEDEELDDELEDEDEPLEDDLDDDEEDDEEDDEDEEEDEEDAGGYGGWKGHHYGHYKRKGSTIRELLNDANIKQYLIVAANLRTLQLSCSCTAEDDSMDKKVLVCKGKGCTVKHGKCVKYKYGYGGHGKYGGYGSKYGGYGHKYGGYGPKYGGYGKKYGHGGHGGMMGSGCTAVTLIIRRPALSCSCATAKRFIDLVDLINDAVKRCGAGGGAIGSYKCVGMKKGHYGHYGKKGYGPSYY